MFESAIKTEFISILTKLKIAANNEHKDVQAYCFYGSEMMLIDQFMFYDLDLVGVHGTNSKGVEILRVMNVRNLDVTYKLVDLGMNQAPSKPIGFA